MQQEGVVVGMMTKEVTVELETKQANDKYIFGIKQQEILQEQILVIINLFMKLINLILKHAKTLKQIFMQL